MVLLGVFFIVLGAWALSFLNERDKALDAKRPSWDEPTQRLVPVQRTREQADR